jgi:hypothetical protein
MDLRTTYENDDDCGRSAAFGLKAFRVGVKLSIFVTLCPAVICWLAFAVALLQGQKHAPIGE